MKDVRKSKTGEPMDDEFFRRAGEKAEAGIDPARLRRRVGRPSIGEQAAELTAVRLPIQIRKALDDRASSEHTTASDVIRRALEKYLAG
jgi:hypothetical protein